jgi:hypothetical protein
MTDINKELSDQFDHFEIFDEMKIYEVEEYFHDYGKSLKKYCNHKYTFSFYKKENGECVTLSESSYIVSEEVYDNKDEIKKLAPFCQCHMCKAQWYDPKRYIGCTHCAGCISDGDDSGNINMTMRETIKFTQKYHLALTTEHLNDLESMKLIIKAYLIFALIFSLSSLYWSYHNYIVSILLIISMLMYPMLIQGLKLTFTFKHNIPFPSSKAPQKIKLS